MVPPEKIQLPPICVPAIVLPARPIDSIHKRKIEETKPQEQPENIPSAPQDTRIRSRLTIASRNSNPFYYAPQEKTLGLLPTSTETLSKRRNLQHTTSKRGTMKTTRQAS